jgi:large repetitive protein
VPLAPSELTVTEVSDNKITISWQESSYNGGAPILDYTLYYRIGDGDLTKLQDGIQGVLGYSIDAEAGTTYTFQLTARNVIGSSEVSQPVEVLAARVPDPPTVGFA